jgi:hypothetical protein
MPGGGGRPGGGCGSWGGEDDGDGAAGRVGEDPRWTVSAVGVRNGRGWEGRGGAVGAERRGGEVPSAAVVVREM